MNQRTSRETRATGLSLSLWNREGTAFLGTFEGATWFEGVTEIRGRSVDPWQFSSAHVQLAAPFSTELQHLALTGPPTGFYVTFTHDGENYSGPGAIIRSSADGTHFTVQGGFEQQR